MGLSLSNSADRFSQDLFAAWDPTSNSFATKLDYLIPGRRFRIDRFTTIYHRPTRRSYIRFFDDTYPDSGVVMRMVTGEVYLLSETVKRDIDRGEVVYDHLRMSHLADPPSGGPGLFNAAQVLGTGDDLGLVDTASEENCYLDLELLSSTQVEESVDAVAPKFTITHSRNVQPAEGDVFRFGARTFVVIVPYVDGGLRMARVSELPIGYTDFIYRRRTGLGGYDPSTGMTAKPVTELAFSGLLGKTVRENEGSFTRRIEVYVYKRHVGFEFEVGNEIEHNGLIYYVDEILDRREEAQWRIEARR